jgi:hypothetical protein
VHHHQAASALQCFAGSSPSAGIFTRVSVLIPHFVLAKIMITVGFNPADIADRDMGVAVGWSANHCCTYSLHRVSCGFQEGQRAGQKSQMPHEIRATGC